MLDFENRLEKYNKNHCWQYEIRQTNCEDDLKRFGLRKSDTEKLKCSDFTLCYEEKSTVFREAKAFIEKHEWLGRLSLYPTHFFTARYNGILAGVVVMDMPNAFSKMLGDNTKPLERLISRGACISWSPKNLASRLIMFAIKWMVKNTRFRLFTAYSDPQAKELGTIYQACNFLYLGQKSGAKYQYRKEDNKWVSDRYFRTRSVYKRMAKALDIEWQQEWQFRDRVFFDQMPSPVAEKIRKAAKDYMESCERRELKPKHKYAYVLGKNKKETKQLNKVFRERNKIYKYPKVRGAIVKSAPIKDAEIGKENYERRRNDIRNT